MILEEKEEAYQYAREVGGEDTYGAEKFADFAIGFHPSFSIEERYISYLMATQGNTQTSMADQSKEFDK